MTGGMTQKGNRRKAFNIKALLHDKENKVTDILIRRMQGASLKVAPAEEKGRFPEKTWICSSALEKRISLSGWSGRYRAMVKPCANAFLTTDRGPSVSWERLAAQPIGLLQ
jgi:hypothetical protein